MLKNPQTRTLMGSQHVKGSETLLKSVWQYFVIFYNQYEKKSARKILS